MSEHEVCTASPSNRRRARRCPLGRQTRIECRRGLTGLGRNLAIAVLDVSATGARLAVDVAVASKEQVEIQFTSSGLQKPLRRGATVAWSLLLENGSHAIGVAFDKPLSYADFQRLART